MNIIGKNDKQIIQVIWNILFVFFDKYIYLSFLFYFLTKLLYKLKLIFLKTSNSYVGIISNLSNFFLLITVVLKSNYLLIFSQS